MMRRGQLIVPGGGVSIRQLPSGQYELRLSNADLAANQARTPAVGDPGDVPGRPINNRPPKLPAVPVIPQPPTGDESGPYGGGSQKGRRIKGATGDDAGSQPYDFNQRGWQWYIDNF